MATRGAKPTRKIPRTRKWTPGTWFVVAHFLLILVFVIVLPGLSITQSWAAVLMYQPPVIYAFGSVVVFTLIALLAKHKRWWWHVLLGLVFSAYIVEPRLPHEVPAKESDQLRVLSINVLQGKARTDRIAQLIRDHDIDVVIFAESKYKSGIDVAERMMKENIDLKHRAQGAEVSIISRFPLQDVNLVNIPSRYDRQLVVTKLETPIGRVQVVGVHWTIPQFLGDYKKVFERVAEEDKNRNEQCTITLEQVSQFAGPTIIGGDFNTPPMHGFYRRMSGVMNDAWIRAGSGFGQTFRADKPITRIDYLWHTDELIPTDCRTIPVEGSDHHALMTTLKNAGRK
ncbi:MAG: endonuclease/exonuclease/phosphatase family protein [Armatimonadetes bacterium]|nr:endonuclease/exonuclease/phosphatase family protein [Armatimonadota bacterium]